MAARHITIGALERMVPGDIVKFDGWGVFVGVLSFDKIRSQFAYTYGFCASIAVGLGGEMFGIQKLAI